MVPLEAVGCRADGLLLQLFPQNTCTDVSVGKRVPGVVPATPLTIMTPFVSTELGWVRETLSLDAVLETPVSRASLCGSDFNTRGHGPRDIPHSWTWAVTRQAVGDGWVDGGWEERWKEMDFRH